MYLSIRESKLFSVKFKRHYSSQFVHYMVSYYARSISGSMDGYTHASCPQMSEYTYEALNVLFVAKGTKIYKYPFCGKRSILRPSRYYLYMSIVSLGDANAPLDNPPGTLQHPKKI